jgi:thiol-disulfide isomerase/thioredoxin
MYRRIAVALLIAGSAPLLLSQNTIASNQKPKGMVLLEQVAQKYEKANSYQIALEQEETITGSLSRKWQRSILSAAVASGDRYRFEAQTDTGWRVQVSDGRTEWEYQPSSNEYTQRALSKADAQSGKTTVLITPENLGLYEARNAINLLRSVLKEAREPVEMQEETINAEGKQIPCYVLRFNRKYTGGDPRNVHRFAIWVDKDSLAVVRATEHAEGAIYSNRPLVKYVQDKVINYSVHVLNPESFLENTFTFEPPKDATLVTQLEDWNHLRNDAIGKPAPAINLRSSDGTSVTLASLQGKPVLLDFWASWCAPCVAAMPSLAKLYQETAGAGLVIISIDEDDDPGSAAQVLAKQHIQWQNFHDDGEIYSKFPSNGVPYYVLIDRFGKVVFSQVGYHGEELRASIAKLGPEFAALTPKPPATQPQNPHVK